MASSLFLLLGGGSTVLNSVIMAALSDCVSADKRYQPFRISAGVSC